MQATRPTNNLPSLQTLKTSNDCLMRTWQATVRTMSEVGSTVADLAKKTWSQIVTSSKQIGPQIVKAFTALKDNCLIPSFNAIKTFAKTNFEALKNFYTAHQDNILTAGAVAIGIGIGSACLLVLPKCCPKDDSISDIIRHHKELYQKNDELKNNFKNKAKTLTKNVPN